MPNCATTGNHGLGGLQKKQEMRVQITDTLDGCNCLPNALTMSWLRLMLNVRPTSRRLPDVEARPCSFCQHDSMDNIVHFIYCAR